MGSARIEAIWNHGHESRAHCTLLSDATAKMRAQVPFSSHTRPGADAGNQHVEPRFGAVAGFTTNAAYIRHVPSTKL